ncbi:MAG: hypothetical protein QMD85_03300 [Candidatus Aenigmarchaeota archaeon]|nr:hypothetical protein [Candidatus Aenigmarchaeota archaeon]MDI6722571.1 hypothetical protein [Candidatus Aenigmarchaeota archaeon]
MAEKTAYKEKKTTFYKIIILVLAVATVFLFYKSYISTGNTISGSDKAAKSAEEVYKLLTDGNAEVLTVKEEAPGLFRVVVKTGTTGGNVNAQEIFITGDGSLITTNVIKVEDYKKNLVVDKQFVQCLFDKSVRIFGMSNETASVLQVQQIGNFGVRIFVDCLVNVQACQQLGVQRFPTTVYNNTGYPGVQSAQFLSQLADCPR